MAGMRTDSPATPDLSKLPIELLSNIAAHLSLCNLAAFASTCRGLRELPKLCVTSEDDFYKLVERDRREPWWRKCVLLWLYSPYGQRPAAWQSCLPFIVGPEAADVSDHRSLLVSACKSGCTVLVRVLIDMFRDTYAAMCTEIPIIETVVSNHLKVLRVLFKEFGHKDSFIRELCRTIPQWSQDALQELPRAAEVWQRLIITCNEDVMLLLVERNLLMDSDVDSVAAASAAKPFIRVAQSLKKSGRRLSPFAAATWLPNVLRWYQEPHLLEWMWWQAVLVSLSGSRKDPAMLYEECVHAVLLYSSDDAGRALRRLQSLARETGGVPIWDQEKYVELLASSDHWSTSRPKAPIGSSKVDRYGYAMTWMLEAAGTAAGHEVLLAALQRALGDNSEQAVGMAVALALALPPWRCIVTSELPPPANCIVQFAALNAALKHTCLLRQIAALFEHLDTPALARWLEYDLDFSSLEFEHITQSSDIVLLLESMSARPGPLADQALQLSRTRLCVCAHFIDRDTYSVEARSKVFKLIAMEQIQPYSDNRMMNQDKWCPLLMRLAPLVSEDVRSEVFDIVIKKTSYTRYPFRELMLELVSTVSEFVYNDMLWGFACYRREFDNNSLMKTLLERRGATTVLVRLAEEARNSKLSFTEQSRLLTSLRALLECAGPQLPSDQIMARIIMCVGSIAVGGRDLAIWMGERASAGCIKAALMLAAQNNASKAVNVICRNFAKKLDKEALQSAYAARKGSSNAMNAAFQAAAKILHVKLEG